MSAGRPGHRGGEGRLSRWSRLKRKRAAGEDVKEPDVDVAGRGAAAPRLAPAVGDDLPAAAGAPIPENAEERELTPEEREVVDTLPPVEELTSDSDFTAFMDKRVPEFIRRKALRKLWLSDPAFSFLDGMNEYDEDYSMVAELAAGASAYRPDQGGYAWQDKPETDAEETAGDLPEGAAGKGSAVPRAESADAQSADDAVSGDAGAADRHGESLIEKARRVQDRGASSVRAPEYTANPYFQAPGMRTPIPDALPADMTARTPDNKLLAMREAAGEESADDDLGDGEDDLD